MAWFRRTYTKHQSQWYFRSIYGYDEYIKCRAVLLKHITYSDGDCVCAVAYIAREMTKDKRGAIIFRNAINVLE